MAAPKSAPGVDAHAHVFSAHAPAVAGARYRPGYEARLEDWMARWQGAGITHGVLVQPSFFGSDNSEMLAALGREPARLRGIAVVEASCDAARIEALHALGVRGVRLNLMRVADLAPYFTPAWQELFARIARRGWHVEVFTDRGALPAIAPAFAAAPDLPIVLDHFGNPGTQPASIEATFAAAESLRARGPLWCKFSGEYRLGVESAAPFAARWLELLGRERIVWGSDWPWTAHEEGRDYGALRARLEAWAGPDARAVLWDNAARLYGFA